MMGPRGIAGVLAFLMMGTAVAEERFYPIVGPDGSITLLRSKDDSSPSATGGASPGSAAPAGQAAPAAGQAAPSVVTAPYDSDDYVDSDSLERAAKAAETRKRFYMIQDGMGQQHLSEDGTGDTSDVPLFQPPKVHPERFRPLPPGLRELDAVAGAARHPGLAACEPESRLVRSTLLQPGEPSGLVLDKQTYTFLDPGRVVAYYRVGGVGLRTLALMSYSRKDRKPAFAHPDLVFLDAAGCMTRVISGYFERLYPATEQRHAMVSAAVVVHAEESFLLVIAPAESDIAGVSLPFTSSRTGQLKFTLEK